MYSCGVHEAERQAAAAQEAARAEAEPGRNDFRSFEFQASLYGERISRAPGDQCPGPSAEAEAR